MHKTRMMTVKYINRLRVLNEFPIQDARVLTMNRTTQHAEYTPDVNSWVK